MRLLAVCVTVKKQYPDEPGVDIDDPILGDAERGVQCELAAFVVGAGRLRKDFDGEIRRAFDRRPHTSDGRDAFRTDVDDVWLHDIVFAQLDVERRGKHRIGQPTILQISTDREKDPV